MHTHDLLPVDDVAAVQVVQRHQQLHKPAHHHVLCEVALWCSLFIGLALLVCVIRCRQAL